VPRCASDVVVGVVGVIRSAAGPGPWPASLSSRPRSLLPRVTAISITNNIRSRCNSGNRNNNNNRIIRSSSSNKVYSKTAS